MAVELALLEQLCEFETALVSEGMGGLGCVDNESHYMGTDIRLLTKIASPLVGIALTMTADTSTPGNTADMADYWNLLERSSRMKLPTIMVVKTIGSRASHECVLGDGMAKLMKSCGSVGLITDGGARDIAQINETGYVVFGSGTVASHVAYKMKMSEDPVTISGVSVSNGDLIHADADGVLVIPAQYHEGLVEACILSRDSETRAHTFWRRTDKTLAQKQEHVAQLYCVRSERLQAYMKSKVSTQQELL